MVGMIRVRERNVAIENHIECKNGIHDEILIVLRGAPVMLKGHGIWDFKALITENRKRKLCEETHRARHETMSSYHMIIDDDMRYDRTSCQSRCHLCDG
jgi:hypothetical protein